METKTTASSKQATKLKKEVTVENFSRAETDMYFRNIHKDGGFGKFNHNRTPTPIDKQTIIRMNRDTLYSVAVFDLDAGPVTITMPDAGNRFMSMQIINEDQYSQQVIYKAGKYTLTRSEIGTRYVVAAIRTLANPNDPKDIDEVHKLQDALKVEQTSAGSLELPDWDLDSQKKIRNALLVLGATLSDSKAMFGKKEEVDPVRFLIGSATGWGGNPEKEAKYLIILPTLNDGKAIHRLTVKDVPVDGFWSISIYNEQGYFQPNDQNAYSINNLTAKKEADGSVIIQFGGCDGKVANCLPIIPGWNCVVRLYRPRPEILEGKWKFPAIEVVS